MRVDSSGRKMDYKVPWTKTDMDMFIVKLLLLELIFHSPEHFYFCAQCT